MSDDDQAPGAEADRQPAPKPDRSERLIALDPQSGTVDADVGSSGRGLYWLLRKVVLGPTLRRLFRPVEEGVENVPVSGPAILAANHLSFADWIFLPLALNRRVTFVAKSDYFTGSGIKGAAQRSFFAGTGQVPIDRTGGKASDGALRAGLRILNSGGLFGIFPEGTRSHDGRLYKGRTGVARLALRSGVPVVPVALVGTDQIAPPGKILRKITSPTVRFGEPLDFSRYAGRESDRMVLRAITDEIMYAILELSGQTYVDDYAPTAKEKARQEQLRAARDWIEARRPKKSEDAVDTGEADPTPDELNTSDGAEGDRPEDDQQAP